MFDWDGRILDNNSILAVKAALPFLDIPVGDVIDLEGLLRAVRGFCARKEQKMIDMFLQVFMMKKMFTVMNAMNEAQNSAAGMEGMFDILKSQIPKEQQEMFDMMSVMMAAMETPSDSGEGDGNQSDQSESEQSESEQTVTYQTESEQPEPKASESEPTTPEMEPEENRSATVDHDNYDDPPMPDIWTRIVNNAGRDNNND